MATLAIVLVLGGWLAGQPGLGGGGGLDGSAGPGGAVGDAYGATTPTGYLLGAQRPDGGFGAAPGQPSSALYAGWAALGLAAEGYNIQDVKHGGASVLDYVRAGPIGDVGSLERTILVVRAAGLPAGSLVSQLEHAIRSDGSVSDQVNLTSFAVLALRAAGVAPSSRTRSWLNGQQDRDGGFNFASAGGSSDVDDTGAALEALAGTAPAATVARAVRFVDSQQNSDGGFPAQPGGESNAQSTAWAVQGLLAVGAAAGTIARAESYLHSITAPDGHVRYSRSSDQTPVWVTAQALMALARKPLPLAPVPRAAAPSAVSARPARIARVASAHHARGARARKGARAPRRVAKLDAFAVDAGVLAALVFAPIGQ